MPNSVEYLSTILLVVTDVATQQRVQNVLKQSWRVIVQNEDQISIASMTQELPHLILTDVHGLNWLERLRHSQPCSKLIPVLLLVTSHEEEFDIKDVDDYFVVASFCPRELVARVRVNIELGQLSTKLRSQVEQGNNDILEMNKNLKVQTEQKIIAVNAFDESEKRLHNMTEFVPKLLELQHLRILAEAEEQQRVKAQEAESSRREKDTFIDTVCHEIRNPLNGFQGNSELLQFKIQEMEQLLNRDNNLAIEFLKENLDELKSSIESIKECISHQTIITNEVLNLSKIELVSVQLNESECYINPLLKRIVTIFASQISAKNLKVSYVLDHNDVYMVDEHKLKQIMINLLLNAIKFSNLNGEIIIRKEYLASQQMIQISVQDFGIGMSTKEQEQIFHRFQQANHSIGKKYGGIGLGLVICSQLVTQMKGTIQLQSATNQGATFTFTVQCRKLDTTQAKESKQQQQHTFKNEVGIKTTVQKLPILVVEDNEINQKVICRFLQYKGFQVEVANNGKEAVDKFQVGKYCLIFMDIVMPEMDGFEATSLIRQKEKQSGGERVSIVCLSGNSREVHIAQATQVGMDDYATKPIKSEVVYKLIEKWAK